MAEILFSSDTLLDDYVLNYEFSRFCGLSAGAYKFWKGGVSAHYGGSRTVFLLKSSVPKKYQAQLEKCSDLSGLVLASAFCNFCGLANSHLVCSNCSKLNELLEIRKISGFKFVNLRSFYAKLGLSLGTKIYIEKCKYFSPEPLEKRIKLTPTLCLGYY